MTLLTWLPEIGILIQLLLAIGLMNFKPFTYRSLALSVTFITALLLFYFGFRTDLNHFDSSFKVISSDSISYFGRIFSLIVICFVGLYLHLQKKLSFESKNKAIIFVLFFALFLNLYCLAASVLLFILGWVGSFVAVTSFILIESNQSEGWIRSLRQYTLPFSVILVLFFLLFLMMIFSSGSLSIADFFEWLEHSRSATNGFSPGWANVFGGLIMLLGALLLHAFVVNVEAPVGLSLFALFIFISNAVYWFRIGIPFLNISGILSKGQSQEAVGIIFAAFCVRQAIRAVRTRQAYSWLSAILFSSVGIGLFLLLLGAEQSLSTFYILSLSFLLTFFFLGQAFQKERYENKVSIIYGIVALLGLPPLVMGEQYFTLMRNTIDSGLVPMALVIVLTWFLLNVAAIQMLSKIILYKLNPESIRRLNASEILLIAIYSICVIALTALKPELVTLLNGHPLPYLW